MSLFIVQPECCRTQLPLMPLKGYWKNKAIFGRVIYHDPVELFDNIQHSGNPYQRVQTKRNFGFKQLFPQADRKVCACGCNQSLTGRRTRWATNECMRFALMVWEIITGRLHTIRKCMNTYHGKACALCGSKRAIEIDHIIPVHKGGGCCWLSNYLPLCNSCHKEKTRSDRQQKLNRPGMALTFP